MIVFRWVSTMPDLPNPGVGAWGLASIAAVVLTISHLPLPSL